MKQHSPTSLRASTSQIDRFGRGRVRPASFGGNRGTMVLRSASSTAAGCCSRTSSGSDGSNGSLSADRRSAQSDSSTTTAYPSRTGKILCGSAGLPACSASAESLLNRKSLVNGAGVFRLIRKYCSGFHGRSRILEEMWVTRAHGRNRPVKARRPARAELRGVQPPVVLHHSAELRIPYCHSRQRVAVLRRARAWIERGV